jgi:DNA modification methylase
MPEMAIDQQCRMVAIDAIKPNRHNRRTHSKRQIHQIEKSIRAFGFTTPVLLDENFVLLAGHGRLQAARAAKLTEVRAVVISGLSEAQKRALQLADNKIAENAGWDRAGLAVEIPELAQVLSIEGLDISITGFEPVEIERLAVDFEDEVNDPEDETESRWSAGPPVTLPGDLWQLGSHRLLCGDARREKHLHALMGSAQADAAFLDPPYNLRVANLVGRGRTRHREFVMGSGEMSPEEFRSFLRETLSAAAKFSRDGAVHYVCMDWRHIEQLVGVGREVYSSPLLNVAVWVKSNAGQGAFYRSQHELIAIFRAGSAPHLNNIQLGRHGRNRSNVWNYAGVNTFRAGRMDELKAHPTAKPIALVADALKDCTRRGDIVLDTFVGSGTTLMAAERVGRTAYALDLDPAYVDSAIRRWQSFARRDAIHAASGRCFDELAEEPVAHRCSQGHARRRGRQ